MHIKNVAIKNFRGIEDIKIEFQPGINLLIGDNGTGKTSILEALTIGLNGLFSGIPGVSAGGFQQTDFRQCIQQVTGMSTSIQYLSPQIDMEIDIEGEVVSVSRKREDPSGDGKTTTSGEKAKKYLQNATNEREFNLPIFSYMGISRVTSTRRADYGKKIRNELNDRRCGYIGCMNSTPDKNSILEWIKKVSYEEVLQGEVSQELKFFNGVVSKMMSRMNGVPEEMAIRFSSVYKTIVYREGNKELPMEYLSAGYQSLLWMTMDYAFRLALLNPIMKNSEQARGIILIDEIDMHLHPKWQWSILSTLGEIFPGIQFIIATHSPMIISSFQHGNLIRLEADNEVNYLDNAYGFSAEDVLTFRQESGGIPLELAELVGRFQEYLDAGDFDKAKVVVDKMESEFGADNTEVKSARFILETERREYGSNES